MRDSNRSSRHGLLESLTTCTGLYVLILCQSRGIPVEGLQLVREQLVDGGDIRGMRLTIQLPPECSEAHHEATFITSEVRKHWGTSVATPSLEVIALAGQATGPN
jgi:hypothetical protein